VELGIGKKYIQKAYRSVLILYSLTQKGIIKKVVMKKIETKWKMLKNGGYQLFSC